MDYGVAYIDTFKHYTTYKRQRLMETLKEQQEFIASIQDNTPLTTEILKEYRFICKRARQEDSDLDGIWYNGYNLCENPYDGSFSFAVYVRGSGCMESGYSIYTVGRLKSLHFGITGRQLTKPIVELENKL